jgi:hypothetical protein
MVIILPSEKVTTLLPPSAALSDTDFTVTDVPLAPAGPVSPLGPMRAGISDQEPSGFLLLKLAFIALLLRKALSFV